MYKYNLERLYNELPSETKVKASVPEVLHNKTKKPYWSSRLQCRE